MKYVEKLLENEKFRKTLEEIDELETDRQYCRHGFAHLMDVARLASMRNIENGSILEQEQIYLAALLHDIGRAEEYKTGISHAAAGAVLAGEILLHIGYPEKKAAQILTVVAGHRDDKEQTLRDDRIKELESCVKEADKKSRACFFCKASQNCKWSSDRKNKAGDWR